MSIYCIHLRELWFIDFQYVLFILISIGISLNCIFILCVAPQNWTETYVRWSPRGTYLATLHKQGVALWGGPEFERQGRFGHNGVQMIDFSPCETCVGPVQHHIYNLYKYTC